LSHSDEKSETDLVKICTVDLLLRFLDHTQFDTHTQQVGLILTNSQLAGVAVHTTHKKHKRRIFMPSAGFKPTLQAVKWPQTYALDCTATGIV